jgi:peptidylprolyl isomerase domain and WD repeat-containing protein 1
MSSHCPYPAPGIQYSARYHCVISADEAGFVEYWQPSEPWTLPENVKGLWQFKSQTDLFEFKKVCRIVAESTLRRY